MRMVLHFFDVCSFHHGYFFIFIFYSVSFITPFVVQGLSFKNALQFTKEY